MRSIPWSLKLQGIISLPIFLLGLMLQGCTMPHNPPVDVKVTTVCTPGGKGQPQGPGGGGGVGACRPKPHGGASAEGFWDDMAGNWVSEGSGAVCTSGTVCKAYAGTCAGTSCIGHYNVDGITGNCACGCQPGF
jgi:hypothetical protein